MSKAGLALVAATAALAVPATAAAAPPPNDNYLSSLRIESANGSLPREFPHAVDTTEATTQADTFDPNADGIPFGGGVPEPTSCPGGPAFGKTVWYDFVPPHPGGVRISAAGYDVVVAVYRWNASTAQLGALVSCGNASSGPAEELLLGPELRAKRNYTIQVGGVAGAGGPLSFEFTYFPDRDGDGILDEQPDACRTLRGIAAFGGCPPPARGVPRILFDRLSGGIRVTSLSVDRVAKGSRLRVSCRSCGRRVSTRARRGGTVDLDAFVGRTVRAGDRIELRITGPRRRSGRFRFGTAGRVIRWPVRDGRLGTRTEHCTKPGSKKRMRCP